MWNSSLLNEVYAPSFVLFASFQTLGFLVTWMSLYESRWRTRSTTELPVDRTLTFSHRYAPLLFLLAVMSKNVLL